MDDDIDALVDDLQKAIMMATMVVATTGDATATKLLQHLQAMLEACYDNDPEITPTGE